MNRRELLAGAAASGAVAAGKADAVGLLSFVKTTTAPSIASLPAATGDVGNWNSFPGASWATSTPFTETTGAVLRRITNATSPVSNTGFGFEYATGGPRISQPFGTNLDKYHVAVMVNADINQNGTIVTFDVQRGVGYVAGTYRTTPSLPLGIIGYCWSMKAGEAHILYYSDKGSPTATIYRYDINAGALAPNSVFPGGSHTAGGQYGGWLTQNWDGSAMLWVTPVSQPDTIWHLDMNTGTVTSNNSTAVYNAADLPNSVNDIRMYKGSTSGGHQVIACCCNNGAKKYWFIPGNHVTGPFASASTQGHSDMDDQGNHYVWNSDSANYPLMKISAGTDPGSNGGTPNSTEVALYNAGSGAQTLILDQHPNMNWNQSGAGSNTWYCFDQDAGQSNSNNRVSANSWTLNSGSIYQTAITVNSADYGASTRGINGVIITNGSSPSTFTGQLTKVGSLGAMTAGTFYWSGTTLYAWMPDNSSPSGKTRLLAAAALEECIGYAKVDGSDRRKLTHTYRNENTSGYGTTPFTNWSPDGKIAMWNCNFGVEAGRIDIVMAEVPLA